jgi:hypothetical protein
VVVRFLNENGLQANVRVLQERGEHFDETNAASALLTNACFRRDDIKEEYGRDDIGAPHALSYVKKKRSAFLVTLLFSRPFLVIMEVLTLSR